MKTIKLYEHDAYIKEFEAKVIECIPVKKGYDVILDQTAFFPEGGGQPSDQGTLNGYPVEDVQMMDGEIRHRISEELESDTYVKGIISWDKRFRIMQNHSGEHIVTGIIHNRFGYDNVGFHMGSEAVTLDLNGTITAEQLDEIEEKANEYIRDNIPIKAIYPTKEEEETLEYRSKMEIERDLRVIVIEGADVCACCGTHTNTTGEIGLIKLLGLQAHKGGVRISMLAGRDALDDYHNKHKQVVNISRMLSAKTGQVDGAVKKMQSDYETLKLNMMERTKELLEEKAKGVKEGTSYLCVKENLNGNDLRLYVNLLMERCKVVLALSPGKDQGFSYIIGSKEQDCKGIGQKLNQEFNGRGGGSPQMVQGNLQGTYEEIKELFISLL